MILFPRYVDNSIRVVRSSFKVPDDDYIQIWNFTTNIRKCSSIKYYENLTSGSRAVKCVQMARHDEGNSRCTLFMLTHQRIT
jgi:hypothetical protein